MADAGDSKSPVRKGVRVRLPPPASFVVGNCQRWAIWRRVRSGLQRSRSVRKLACARLRGVLGDSRVATPRRAGAWRMTAIGRNAPCPCGSGQKYKHCCVGFPGREPPQRAFRDLGALPEIRGSDDLQPFWDEYLNEFIPLQGPLVPAIARVLRAVDIQDTLVALGSLPEHWGGEWHKDESLRYATRHLYSTERPLGDIRPYSKADAEFGKRAVISLGRMSLVRDHIESVRLGLSRVEIDTAKGTIRFFESSDTIADMERREYRSVLKRARRQAANKQGRRIADEGLALVKAVRAEIGDDPLWMLGSSSREERITELLLRIHGVLDDAPPDRWLPDNIDLGCYTTGQFRRFTEAFLWALSMMHESLMIKMIEAMPTRPVFISPEEATPMVSQLDYLIAQASRLGGVSEGAAAEIVRDLTYSTEVSNPTPSVHPLLPIGGGRFLTIPRLLRKGGADWVGWLLRILERAPWRTEARRHFGERREGLMQDALELGIRTLGVETRRNVKIGPKAARIGDIDLLVFRRGEPVGLALSLKWYYPPNLVQEVASQSARLRDAVERHLRVVEAFRSDYESNRRSHGLPPNVEFQPAVVVHPGPVFERARIRDVPVVTGGEFLALAAESSSLDTLTSRIRTYEAPRLKTIPSKGHKIALAKYTFELPVYFIPPSEREKFGPIEELARPRMPWDLGTLES